MLKSSSDSFKLADDLADTGKAIPDVSDEVKILGDNTAATEKAVADRVADTVKAADAEKTAEHMADTVKRAESGKTVERVADTTKATNNGSDAVKAVNNGSDTAKALNNASDTNKAVGDVPDVVNPVDYAKDTVKEAAQTSDVSKVTANYADADDAVKISIEKSKEMGDQDCIVKNADPTADSNIHVEKNVSVVPNRTANLDGNSAYNGGNYSGLRDLMTPEEIARYDEYWLDVAEQISNEALDDQILFIKNGGITKPGGGAYKPVKISATVDLNTGEIYIGYNGANKFNPSRMEIHSKCNTGIKKCRCRHPYLRPPISAHFINH